MLAQLPIHRWALLSAGCLLLSAHLCSLQADSVIELNPLLIVAPNTLGPGEALSAQDTRTAKPIDLAEILSQRMPQFALSRRGPVAGDLVLRGLSRDNLLITVDQTKTFCACPNRMDPPAFHVSSQQIEMISVRSGPFSVEDGGSIGGSIQIRTALPQEQTASRLYAFAGSHGYYATGGQTNVHLTDSLDVLSGFYYQRGNVYKDGNGTRFTQLPGANYQPDFIDGAAFKVLTADGKVSYRLGEHDSLTVTYGYQDARDVLYPGLRMDAITDSMHRASIGYQRTIETTLADSLSASLAFSRVEHDMTDAFRLTSRMNPLFAARGFMMRTEAQTAFYGLRFNADKTYTDSYLRYGIDFNRRHWDADNSVGPNSNNMLPDVLQQQAALWGRYEQRWQQWAFETGLRLEVSGSHARDDISFLQSLRTTDTNRRTDTLPSAYALLSRKLSDSWRSYMGFGFASRAPDPQERYINLNRPSANPDWIGNPSLQPVKTFEAQGGVEYRTHKASLSLTAFHSWLNDYIYLESFVNGAGQRATSYTNIDARLHGLSLNSAYNLTPSWQLQAGLAAQTGHKRTLPNAATNDVLAEVPPLRALLGTMYQYENWRFQLSGHFQNRHDRLDTDLNERLIEAWATINLSIGWQINETFSASLGLDNVTGAHYATANAYVRDPFSSGVIVNEPGRTVYARLSAQF